MGEVHPHAGVLATPGTQVVIVGTAEHVAGSSLPNVPSVATTIRDLGHVLVERCGLDQANLITVLNPESPQRMHEVLAIAGEHATDTLALFFAGHGLVGQDHELYLATSATRDLGGGSPVFEAFPYGLLREVVGQSRARAVLVVLDCCHSRLAHGVTQRVVETLADTAELSGFSLLTSTGAEELAWAPTDQEHTAFSGELIRLLREGDPSAGAALTVDTVYQSLVRRLAERDFPKPYLQIANGAGRWVLAPNTVDAQPSPYRGLAFFRQEDAEYFFGRDDLIGELVDRLGAQLGDGGPLIVTGSSGAGKSSLLRAGLIPALARMDLRPRGAPRWAARVLTPGSDPLAQLAMWLATPARLTIRELRERLRRDPGELAAVLRAASQRTGEQVLLVVDQFEELFTACEDESARRAFVEALAAAAGPASGTAVLLGLRAGYFGRCARYPELVPALERALVVTPMSLAEVRQAIEKPAERAGLTLEKGLVELLLSDLGDTVSLPLLSHALLTTWRHREGDLLTLAGYRATGGIQQAVGRTADELYDRLDEISREVARRLVVRLVRIGDGTGDTRRRLPLSELMSSTSEVTAAQHVLNELTRARLIRIDRDTADSVEFVEIAHEALLRAWPRLQKWISVDRAGLLVRQQLTEAAVTWDRHQRDPEYLYPSSRLAEVHAWLREHHTEGLLGPTEQAFVDASRQRRRAAVRRRRLSFLTLVVLLVLTITATVITAVQRASVERSRTLARSQVIARTASELRAIKPTMAMQLGLAAFQTLPTPDTRGALLSAVSIPLPTVLAGHTGRVDGLVFGPDGQFVATAAEDHTAKLWMIKDPGKPVNLPAPHRGIKGYLYDLAVSPNGKYLAAAAGDPDNTVWVWDITDHESPRLLTASAATLKHDLSVRGVAFSRDSTKLASASTDGTARLWTVPDFQLLATIRHSPVEACLDRDHKPNVECGIRDVAFSPDGNTLATASQDKTVQLWNIEKGNISNPIRRSHPITEHTDTVRKVLFSPDGGTLATASNDHTAKLFDVTNPELPKRRATILGHTDSVFGLAFSSVPDQNGRRMLATAAADNTARLWDMTKLSDITYPQAPALLSTITGHTDTVTRVAFSPDNRTLATSSFDGTGKLWNISDPEHPATLRPALGQHQGSVLAVAFSPDGRYVATGAEDGIARIWNVENPKPELKAVTDDLPDPVRGVAFDPRSGRLATATTHMTLLWGIPDLTKADKPIMLKRTDTLPDANFVNAVAFSPNGQFLAAGSGDRTVSVWDLTNRDREPMRLPGLDKQPGPDKRPDPYERHTSYVYTLAFSPDSMMLATGGDDRKVLLWKLANPAKPIVAFQPHLEPVQGVAFSPDSNTLATASSDRTVNLWDVSHPDHPSSLAPLRGHTGAVWSVAFSPDGNTVATTSKDGTVRLWSVTDRQNPTQVAKFEGHAGHVNAVAFDPDGRRIVTGSADGTARLWELDTGTVEREVCDATTKARITQEEWETALPGIPYHNPCPR